MVLIRGTKTPLLVLLRSSKALGSGVLVPIPTLFCALPDAEIIITMMTRIKNLFMIEGLMFLIAGQKCKLAKGDKNLIAASVENSN